MNTPGFDQPQSKTPDHRRGTFASGSGTPGNEAHLDASRRDVTREVADLALKKQMVRDAAQRNSEYKSAYQDILAQAITGELIGMRNFATLAGVHTDIGQMIDAVEHANIERGHAVAFQKAAERLGVTPRADVDAPYWARIRSAFLKWAERGDIIACTIIQELMLESFAISLYRSAGEGAKGELATLFAAVAGEEEAHLDHAVQMLTGEYELDPVAFTAKMKELHDDVMTVLAEMVGRRDSIDHCGLCTTSCVKESLGLVNLDIAVMRGKAINGYLRALDRVGLPGEETLQWTARLPV